MAHSGHPDGRKSWRLLSKASLASIRLGDLPHDVAEFTVPEGRRTIRAGIRLYRARLGAEDVTIVEGLPVTTIVRTVADLLRSRKHGDPEHVARIVGDALVEARLDVDQLSEQLEPVASRYGQPDGESFAAWLVDLSGNGPADLAAKLSRTAVGRQVVNLALENALPGETDVRLRHLTDALAHWIATHPGIEKDLDAAVRAALSDRNIAEAIDAVRHLSTDDRKAIERSRRELSRPSTQRDIREARQALAKVDPALIQAVAAIGGQR